MTLADLLQSPRPLAELRGLALVFDAALRDRLLEVHGEHGAKCLTALPAGPATDGRYYYCADIITEVGSGGIYHAGFSHLDASRFGEAAVIPMADALALLPESPSSVS
jgi:hypothetical protein